MATMTRSSGLNAETYNGPLVCKHHAIAANEIPEFTIPCINYIYIYIYEKLCTFELVLYSILWYIVIDDIYLPCRARLAAWCLIRDSKKKDFFPCTQSKLHTRYLRRNTWSMWWCRENCKLCPFSPPRWTKRPMPRSWGRQERPQGPCFEHYRCRFRSLMTWIQRTPSECLMAGSW